MMMPPVLIIDGNRAEIRAQQQAAGGSATGEGYAAVLQSLMNDLQCEIVRPADGEVKLQRGLRDYAGVIITGSALNIYDGGAHIERQIELARAVFAAGVPFFGSCWGLQVAVTAAGGVVRPNPLGREFGFGRRITLTTDGLKHPLFLGKPPVFEAITVHRDDIAALPPNSVELARNEMGLQAAEIKFAHGVFWGTQYHPEYSFNEIAATTIRYGKTLVNDGLFADQAELESYADDLRGLQKTPDDRRLNWRYGLGPALSDQQLKLSELRNWLQQRVVERQL
jgi:GMP synthase (glutamine-hydrolysing)